MVPEKRAGHHYSGSERPEPSLKRARTEHSGGSDSADEASLVGASSRSPSPGEQAFQGPPNVSDQPKSTANVTSLTPSIQAQGGILPKSNQDGAQSQQNEPSEAALPSKAGPENESPHEAALPEIHPNVKDSAEQGELRTDQDKSSPKTTTAAVAQTETDTSRQASPIKQEAPTSTNPELSSKLVNSEEHSKTEKPDDLSLVALPAPNETSRGVNYHAGGTVETPAGVYPERNTNPPVSAPVTDVPAYVGAGSVAVNTSGSKPSVAEPPIDVDLVICTLNNPEMGAEVMKAHANAITAHKQVQAYAKLAGSGWTYYVQQLQVVIGRNAADSEEHVDIDLAPSKIVSRRHAVIRYNLSSRLWEVVTFGRNGIRIDNVPVRPGQTATLTSGTVIDAGNMQMMFVLPDAEPKVAPIYIHRLKEHQAARAAQAAKGAVHSQVAENTVGAPTFPGSGPNGAGMGSAGSSLGGSTSIPNHGGRSGGDTVAYPRGVTIVSRPQVAANEHYMHELSSDECKDIKPPFSYATMIAQSILSTPEHKMTLADIYAWIAGHYAFYRHSKPGWQNSIRHNLSLNRCFERAPRKENEPGKGSKWFIVDTYKDEFIRKATTGQQHKGAYTPRRPYDTASSRPVQRNSGANNSDSTRNAASHSHANSAQLSASGSIHSGVHNLASNVPGPNGIPPTGVPGVTGNDGRLYENRPATNALNKRLREMAAAQTHNLAGGNMAPPNISPHMAQQYPQGIMVPGTQSNQSSYPVQHLGFQHLPPPPARQNPNMSSPHMSSPSMGVPSMGSNANLGGPPANNYGVQGIPYVTPYGIQYVNPHTGQVMSQQPGQVPFMGRQDPHQPNPSLLNDPKAQFGRDHSNSDHQGLPQMPAGQSALPILPPLSAQQTSGQPLNQSSSRGDHQNTSKSVAASSNNKNGIEQDIQSHSGGNQSHIPDTDPSGNRSGTPLNNSGPNQGSKTDPAQVTSHQHQVVQQYHSLNSLQQMQQHSQITLPMVSMGSEPKDEQKPPERLQASVELVSERDSPKPIDASSLPANLRRKLGLEGPESAASATNRHPHADSSSNRPPFYEQQGTSGLEPMNEIHTPARTVNSGAENRGGNDYAENVGGGSLLGSAIKLPPSQAAGLPESSPALWKYMNLESTPNHPSPTQRDANEERTHNTASSSPPRPSHADAGRGVTESMPLMEKWEDSKA